MQTQEDLNVIQALFFTPNLTDLHSGLGIVSRLLNVSDGLNSIVNLDLRGDHERFATAAAAARNTTDERRNGSVAHSKEELGVDLNELAFSTEAPGGDVVTARSLVGDLIEQRIIEVNNVDIVLGTEIAAARSTAVSFLLDHDGGVPLQTILSYVDIL